MSGLSMASIRPEQGPPLSVPLGFFATGPLSVAVAGALLVVTGGRDGGSAFSGFTLALVHLTTVGFLMMVMTGALYQLLPVVGGAVVPWPRLGHAVNALLALGVALLAGGLVADTQALFLGAFSVVTLALALFLGPTGWAIARSKAPGATPLGLRLALFGLIAVATIGLRLAWARGTTGYTETWMTWRHAHAHLGLIGWVGTLIASVSWQVVPMFYLAPEVPRVVQRTVLAGSALTVVGLLVAFFVELPDAALIACVVPGALAVWVVQPLSTVRALLARKRKRRDPSAWFWFLAMGLAPVVLVLDVATVVADEPVFGPLFAFVALWGWAGALVHGMLTRIVPFLVWLHRCSRWVGLRPGVPSARELYPDRWAELGFLLHVVTLGLGVAAFSVDAPWLWRGFGAGLAATMGLVSSQVIAAVRRAPRLEAADAPKL